MSYYYIGYIFVNMLLFGYIIGAWISCIRYYVKGNCFQDRAADYITLNLYSITDRPISLVSSTIVLFLFGQAAAIAWIVTVPVGIFIMVIRYFHKKNRRTLEAINAIERGNINSRVT